MSQFTTPLRVEFLNGRLWKTIEPFVFQYGNYPAAPCVTIEVPRDFVMDFASIPRIFWSILPPTGIYGKAAVVHDWLYRKQIYDRKTADLMFLQGMEVLEVPKWKRVVIYRSVRLFGWNAWRKRKKQNERCI